MLAPPVERPVKLGHAGLCWTGAKAGRRRLAWQPRYPPRAPRGAPNAPIHSRALMSNTCDVDPKGCLPPRLLYCYTNIVPYCKLFSQLEYYTIVPRILHTEAEATMIAYKHVEKPFFNIR